MPEISQAILCDWCVVWQRSDTKTRHGQPRVSSPVNVRCRWNISDQVNPTQEMATEQYPRSVPVGIEVVLGSFVWGPGKIADLPASPTYFEVIASSKVPDLKGRHYSYNISLQKASKTLPDLV